MFPVSVPGVFARTLIILLSRPTFLLLSRRRLGSILANAFPSAGIPWHDGRLSCGLYIFFSLENVDVGGFSPRLYSLR